MSVKARVAALEAARYERELDRCARFLAARHRCPAGEVRRELEEILARRKAEGGVLSPEELQQAEQVRQEMDAWESSRG